MLYMLDTLSSTIPLFSVTKSVLSKYRFVAALMCTLIGWEKRKKNELQEAVSQRVNFQQLKWVYVSLVYCIYDVQLGGEESWGERTWIYKDDKCKYLMPAYINVNYKTVKKTCIL